MTVMIDKYTKVLLTAIAVLLFVIGAGLWCAAPPVISTAQAGIPDSGQQLDVIVNQISQITASLGDLKQTLTSGKIKVQIVTPDGQPVKAQSNDDPAGKGK